MDELPFNQAKIGKKITYKNYWIKSFKWFLGNCFFGLSPLLFILVVYGLSEGKSGFDELNKLIHDGIILWLCVALTGAVVIDFFISGFRAAGFTLFSIYFFPLIPAAIISIDYLLIYLKVIDHSCFYIDSLTTKFVTIFTFLYCTFAKASLFIKEDNKHKK